MANIEVTSRYPESDEFEYETVLTRLNMDEERRRDIVGARGFVISSPKPIKDDVKDINGIFSTRFGMSLQDSKPYAHKYRCKCGETTTTFMNGQPCPICGHPVKKVDDDFQYFGWIILKEPYYLIHPTLFLSLSAFIGVDPFNNIIEVNTKKDEDGHDMERTRPKNEPFHGIGMMEFKDRFDEIMEFYRRKAKTQNKIDMYNDIMDNKDIIFTQSIPVFTTLLRPYRLDGEDLHFEGTNAIYKMAATLAAHINDDTLKMNRKAKNKSRLLYDLQMKVKKLSDEINAILAGKKGTVRQLFGGRFNFTSRSVIGPDNTLRPDQIKLSYPCLCGLLQQRIISVLHRSYNMQYHNAAIYLMSHDNDHDALITTILEGFIRNDSEGNGIACLINRNPTIGIGGILQCYVVGISNGYTMSMPTTVLKGLAADFDGDTLNIMWILNENFRRAAELILNVRNAMMISKNDGMFDPNYNHQRDTIINANTIVYLSRANYSKALIDKIAMLKRGYIK